MLSARPYLQQSLTSADYAEARLRGTVWERMGSAHLLYRALMAIGRGLGALGVSANTLTYGSLVLAIFAAISAASGHFALAALLVVLSGVLDVFDGVVARATHTVSRYGALLDSTVDRLADGLPLLGVAIFYGDAGYAAAVPAVAMLGGFAVSYARARAEALGAKLPALFMRRAERVILVTICLLLGAVTLDAPVHALLLLVGLGVIAILNFVGVVAVLRAAKRALAFSPPDSGSASES